MFKSTNPDIKFINDYINDTNIDYKLTTQESDIMQGRLTIDECTDSLFKMKLNKAPETFGLSVEFKTTTPIFKI